METSSEEQERLADFLRSTFADGEKMRTLLRQRDQLAQSSLDLMQQLLDYPNTPSELRPSILKTMLRLSKNSGLYPQCLIIQNVRKLGDYPVASGGFGDVWKGVIGNSTEPVCLKVLKTYHMSDVEKLSELYLREAMLWRQMKHPNLLPFIGIFHFQHNRPCLISPWMEKGNLVQYLELTPRKNVEHHTLAYDVASGLHHLHINKIVHGDLKGVNVLITNEGRACLADFGLSRVAHTYGLQLLTTSSSLHTGTTRWMAPELINGSRTSEKSDIYAYGCVCWEIFTGSRPFPELAHDGAVMFNVVQGKRMSRPHDVAELTDDMWAIMESCWNVEEDVRPSTEDVLSKIKLAKRKRPTVEKDSSDTLPNAEVLERMKVKLSNKKLRSELLGSRERRAETALDELQCASYLPECEPALRSDLLHLISQLSEASDRYVPSHYNPTVQKLGNGPVSSKLRASLEVWEGKIGGSSEIVALKVVKSKNVAEVGEKLKVYMREIVKWRMANHSNVVPFIGNFSFGENRDEICLVSPWIENGNIVEYLQHNSAETLKRFTFAWDVASGLEYLHSMGIVHGNLKGNNVMITRDEMACITDYGVVPVLNSGGNIRPTPWCAREVLAENVLNEKSDVYALGFVCYEIFVGRIPLLDMEENELRKAIVEQKLQVDRPKVNEPFPWEIMQSCWTGDLASRPSATDVLKNLEEMEIISEELVCLAENLRLIFADEAKFRDFLKHRGPLAQSWLDLMQQLLDYPNTPSELRPSILKTMLRLSKNSRLYPKCLMIQNVRKWGDDPVTCGSYGDIWKGVIGSSNASVCLKVVKIYRNSNVEKLSELREAILWRQMKHPNLLPFIGVSRFQQNRLCLISPWMKKGNLVEYLELKTRKNVEHHMLACDVASGLHHLHINKIVHGDLKGENVLITNEGRACLADFGFSRVAHIYGLQLTTSSTPAGTARWMAPELLNGSQTSEKSDIYAYGCVCWEIFTGSFPFPELDNIAVVRNVTQGKRMSKPKDRAELTDNMWAIMESCWNVDGNARPSAEDVLSEMKPVN